MNIPILNLYYLLIYSWDSLEEAELIDVEIEDKTKLVELFGRVLNSGVEHLLRRGLDRQYLEFKDVIPGIKGKVDLTGSVKQNLRVRARALCEFDELNHNIIHNRIIKSTIRLLCKVSDLPKGLKSKLEDTYRRLGGIDEVSLSEKVFRSVQLHRNIRFYRFLLDVCKMIKDNLFIDEQTGRAKFRDFYRDEKLMRTVFENFVRNFYLREQTVFKVHRDKTPWQKTTGDDQSLVALPQMKTDVSLTSTSLNRKIIIETKFSPQVFKKHYEKLSLRSEHLYQLFSYIMNIAAKGGINKNLEAILLYPTAQSEVDLLYEMHGHSVRIFTLNLNQSWEQIHQDLLALLDPSTLRLQVAD